MKKIISIFLVLCALLSLSACGSSQSSSSVEATEQATQTPAPTVTPKPTPKVTPKPTPKVTPHTHTFGTGTITKEATCGKDGTRKYTCSCGYSYTDTIDATGYHDWTDATCAKPKTCKVCGETRGSKSSYHDWEYATCTKPKTCKVCGKTEGKADGHYYYSDGKCSCGAINPALANTSLSLPSLPKTVTYYGYGNKKYSSVEVTNIKSEIGCNNDGYINIKVYFSGTKTYDYQGSGQSSSCKIGWKLYGSDGSVIEDGTFYSPAVKVGESFSNKDCTVLYSSEKCTAGQYRLELLDIN